MTKNAYTENLLNSSLYSRFRCHFSELWESEKYFLTSHYIGDGASVLDVGGACGGFGNAIIESVQQKVDYTCVDPDKRAIELGKVLYPNFKFITGAFPECMPRSAPLFDYVMLNGWFAQVTDWKGMLLTLKRFSKRFINVGLNLRLDGTTVVDPDVSYFYYLDSGVRVPEITHNLYELINFCSIHEMNAKQVSLYCYTTPDKPSSAFRPLSRRNQLQGNLLIELFSQEDGNPTRIGGISNEAQKVLGGEVEKPFRPIYDIIINNEKIDF